jgi:ribosome maturation factor RimP
MSGKILDPSVESEIAAVAAGVGCELAHAEWQGGVLRVFLDREEGVGLEHCEAVARQLSPLLDALEFGSGRYTLEVSSPGLDRQLHRPRDYERFAGRLARVQFRAADTGRKRTVVGRLGAPAAPGPTGAEEVRVEDRETGELHVIPMASIIVARLEVEL